MEWARFFLFSEFAVLDFVYGLQNLDDLQPDSSLQNCIVFASVGNKIETGISMVESSSHYSIPINLISNYDNHWISIINVKKLFTSSGDVIHQKKKRHLSTFIWFWHQVDDRLRYKCFRRGYWKRSILELEQFFKQQKYSQYKKIVLHWRILIYRHHDTYKIDCILLRMAFGTWSVTCSLGTCPGKNI